MMSFKDIIKNKVYESLGGITAISFTNMLSILAMACLIGIYIYFVYKLFCKSAFYSRDLNITLAGMTVVVAAILIAMQSNLVVSLGMVGALSIVRFRTAIKNPLDLLYLFWSISGGIICGVNLLPLAILLCLVMTLLIWALGTVPNLKAPAVLVVRMDSNCDCSKIEAVLKETCTFWKQSSIQIRNGESESIYEVKTKKRDEMLDCIQKNEAVRCVNWLEYDGEIRG